MQEDNENDLEAISSADIELVIMGIVAFWGDGKLTKKEMEVIERSWESKKDELNLVEYSDHRDLNLSKQEYILGLFEFLKTEEKRISSEDTIELPEKFEKANKKKLAKMTLSNRQRAFIFLIEDLGDLYDKEYKNRGDKRVASRFSRMTALQTDLLKLASADGKISNEEREMIGLMKHESKIKWWVWVVWIIILYVLYYAIFGR